MHFHSNEKIKHQTPQTFLKNHNGKNVSAHSNATTLTKLPEPTMTLKILEAKINHSSMKSTEMNLYCKVIYGCQEWNTNVETVMNYNPKWQESKTFILNHDVRKRSNSTQYIGIQDTIQKNEANLFLNPEYLDIILFQKRIFNLFSDNEVGRIRLNIFELLKFQSKTEWFPFKNKKETKGSILICYNFEKIQSMDVSPKNFKATYCKLIGVISGKEEKDKVQFASKKIKDLNENQNITSHYRVQTETQESSQLRFNFAKNDAKVGCKTETSFIENEHEMISEDSSYENQDEIQKKFDQIDKKEVLSLNDEWFEKFEDLDENGTNEEHIDNNDSNDVYDNNWNNLFYGNQEIDLNNITRILEVIKEENALLKKKEQNIKGNFEKLKYDYTRIAKEKKLVENKINQLNKRENCMKNEKKFLKNEFENFKNEQMELQKAIDTYNELNNNFGELKRNEEKIIRNNLEMEEKILCISRSNMYLPKALFLSKKDFLKNIMNNKILLYNSQSNNENSFQNLNSYYKSEKKLNDKKSFVELEEEYKQKLCGRMGLERKFDYWQYWNQLKNKNKMLANQIENKKQDIEYMGKRMKL